MVKILKKSGKVPFLGTYHCITTYGRRITLFCIDTFLKHGTRNKFDSFRHQSVAKTEPTTPVRVSSHFSQCVVARSRSWYSLLLCMCKNSYKLPRVRCEKIGLPRALLCGPGNTPRTHWHRKKGKFAGRQKQKGSPGLAGKCSDHKCVTSQLVIVRTMSKHFSLLT